MLLWSCSSFVLTGEKGSCGVSRMGIAIQLRIIWRKLLPCREVLGYLDRCLFQPCKVDIEGDDREHSAAMKGQATVAVSQTGYGGHLNKLKSGTRSLINCASTISHPTAQSSISQAGSPANCEAEQQITMAIDRRKVLLFGAAAAIRLTFFYAFPSLPELLAGRVEISTPVTSYKRLKEGLFLYTHNVSPYDGGVFHQAPLLLSLFAIIPPPLFSIMTNLLYILVDLLCAEALARIASTGESRSTRLFTSPRKDIMADSTSVAGA